jgi:hypothetical protein
MHFIVHISRATTITNVLEGLLKHAGLQDPGKSPPAAVQVLVYDICHEVSMS